MKTHFTPRYFSNPTHPISISVIGCGGTGSMLLTRIARLNHELVQLGHPGVSLTCYDDDIVEQHNIGRQSFIPNEVGLNKAFVIISKINLAYGLDWKAFPIRLTDANDVLDSNIIVTCVDKVDIRMKLSEVNLQTKYIDYKTPFYWLDCGNGKDFGQVVLGTLADIEQPNVENIETTPTLKSVVDMYGNLSDYDNEDVQGIESCSFLDSILKQDLFINDEIALSAAKLLRTLLKSPYITSNGTIVSQKENKSQPFLIS